MFDIAKNITKNLAVSKEVANIAMPNVHCSSDRAHISDFRNKAGLFCGAIPLRIVDVWRRQQKRLASFLHTIKTFRPCQTSLKVSARSTVRPLRLVPMVRNHSNSLPKSNLSSYWRVTLPNLSHLRAFTAVRFRLLASGATTSSKAATHRCTNSPLNSKPSNLSIVSDNRPLIPVPL